MVDSISHLGYNNLNTQDKVKLAFENKKEIQKFSVDETGEDFNTVSFEMENGNEMGNGALYGSYTALGTVVLGVGAFFLTGGAAGVFFAAGGVMLGPALGSVGGSMTKAYSSHKMYFTKSGQYSGETFAAAMKKKQQVEANAARDRQREIVAFGEEEEEEATHTASEHHDVSEERVLTRGG